MTHGVTLNARSALRFGNIVELDSDRSRFDFKKVGSFDLGQDRAVIRRTCLIHVPIFVYPATRDQNFRYPQISRGGNVGTICNQSAQSLLGFTQLLRTYSTASEGALNARSLLAALGV